jgi:hypothetical protein
MPTSADILKIESTNCEITAPTTIVASNTPINDRFAMHTKQAPYRTYVIAVRVPHGAVTPALVGTYTRNRQT